MLRISKLTDYSIVVMGYFAREPDRIHNARDIVTETHISLPTISKILKRLSKGGLLRSHRGTKGGYTLILNPADISLAHILSAIDGKLALTECSAEGSHCAIETVCHLRHQWPSVSQIVYTAFQKIKLPDMLRG
jgi:FeS assembly SUF system regulator